MSQLGLKGKAVVPHPSIVVNFRSWSSGCEEPTNCSVQIADTVLRQGQGMHGSFSRGDTLNFTAAIGPDFKSGYVDPLPVSNADVGATAAKLLGLTQKAKGKLIGRVMTEADAQRRNAESAYAGTVTSKPAANGLRTVLNFQRVGSQRYFDAAGFPGRTLGLEAGRRQTKKRPGNNSPHHDLREIRYRPTSRGTTLHARAAHRAGAGAAGCLKRADEVPASLGMRSDRARDSCATAIGSFSLAGCAIGGKQLDNRASRFVSDSACSEGRAMARHPKFHRGDGRRALAGLTLCCSPRSHWRSAAARRPTPAASASGCPAPWAASPPCQVGPA